MCDVSTSHTRLSFFSMYTMVHRCVSDRVGFWVLPQRFLHSSQESFAFHFRAALTWQSDRSDQRREFRASARFVSSRSLTQLSLPNGTEADTHPNGVTSKEADIIITISLKVYTSLIDILSHCGKHVQNKMSFRDKGPYINHQNNPTTCIFNN